MIRELLVICMNYFALATYIPQDEISTIIRYDFENNGKGNYTFSYERSNRIKRNETGQLVNGGQNNEYVSVHGFYSYMDPEGSQRSYEYSADKNGNYVHVGDTILSSKIEDDTEIMKKLQVQSPKVEDDTEIMKEIQVQSPKAEDDTEIMRKIQALKWKACLAAYPLPIAIMCTNWDFLLTPSPALVGSILGK